MNYALRVSVLGILVWSNYFSVVPIASAIDVIEIEPLDMLLTYEKSPTDTGTHVVAKVMVATYNVPLNAFEVELQFDPTVLKASSITFHDTLCEEHFVIDKVIDHEAGIIHASCGTISPFVTGSDSLAILSVAFEGDTDQIPPVWFGPKTGLHIHNGLGTRAPLQLTGLVGV